MFAPAPNQDSKTIKFAFDCELTKKIVFYCLSKKYNSLTLLPKDFSRDKFFGKKVFTRNSYQYWVVIGTEIKAKFLVFGVGLVKKSIKECITNRLLLMQTICFFQVPDRKKKIAI